MKNEKITLTAIEKEKLLACVAIVAKDFELKRLSLEKEIDEIENEGGQEEHLIDRIEHYRDRQSFYEMLEQKVMRAIKYNQI